MTDKYIGKPVLKHCYCEHEYKKSESKMVHQKVPKVRKKDIFKAGIEPRMVNSLKLKELDMQNTTSAWFGT